MPEAESSPMRQLVAIWRSCRLPSPTEVSACRARLSTAAVHAITSKAQQGIPYDPLMDTRFKWAAQWLDVADGSRRHIDQEVDFLFRLSMDQAPLSRKLLSANDLEPSSGP